MRSLTTIRDGLGEEHGGEQAILVFPSALFASWLCGAAPVRIWSTGANPLTLDGTGMPMKSLKRCYGAFFDAVRFSVGARTLRGLGPVVALVLVDRFKVVCAVKSYDGYFSLSK